MSRLPGYKFVSAISHSRQVITPKFIIMHYTAGLENTVQYFSRTKSVSAHFVVTRLGEVVQMVPLDNGAWHAGRSSYEGFTGLNRHSIGIEIENLGPIHDFKKESSLWSNKIEKVQIWNKKWLTIPNHLRNNFRLLQSPDPYNRVGPSMLFWEEYTDAQLEAVDKLVKNLIDNIPSLRGVTSHAEIDTRGWKSDPGPAFPMRRYEMMFGNDRGHDFDKFIVTNLPKLNTGQYDSLNVRSGPSTGFGVIATLNQNDIVDVVDKKDNWYQIKDIGWVFNRYLQRV